MRDDSGGWEQLAPGCARRRLPGFDATAGVVAGAERLLVVDTGATLHEGERLRAEIRALTGRAPTDAVLTHGHFDHVLGTAAFAGARVHAADGLAAALAAPDARLRAELLADAVHHGIDPGQAAAAVEALAVPDVSVEQAAEYEMDLGDRRVVLAAVGPGHTGFDLAVLVPGAPAVVFCGDLVEESGEPQAGPDAVPHRWPRALDRLLDLGGETALYVPGHGAVVGARFVRAQRDALARRFGTA